MSPSFGVELAERGLVADTLVRYGIRRWLRRQDARRDRPSSAAELATVMRAGPITLPAAGPAERHAELPVTFFEQVLGPHLKCSCSYWPESIETLADAEAAMLALTCERAGLADGQRVLELGCGWGSLALWMARRYPNSRIVAVCRSHAQRAFIEARRLPNLEVVVTDLEAFTTQRRFDRVVTVETFERLWNWELLLSRIAAWLEPDGKLFVHLACHAHHPYPLEPGLLAHVLTGRRPAGIMPSADLIHQFRRELAVEQRWMIGGEHYARTAEAWRIQLEARREWVLPVLAACYGRADAARRYHRWRLSFLACAEVFGFRGGSEWGIAHYRLGKS